MRPPLVACLCNAFDQRLRAGFGAALARVTSVPPPPFKYPASALRASAVAARGTRPPAVNAPQNLRHPFHGDRPALLPLGQLVDFPYRSGDMVDLQQSPGFRLRDRFLLSPLGGLPVQRLRPALARWLRCRAGARHLSPAPAVQIPGFGASRLSRRGVRNPPPRCKHAARPAVVPFGR